MKHVLIVDGYNIIGAWPELKRLKDIDFAGARDLLIEKMAEYQAYTGYRVIVVFDAHMVPGIEKIIKKHNVEVLFTRENETADERIEKMAKELQNVRTKVHVATSDSTEQWVIFGQGALRISARELLTELSEIEKQIQTSVEGVKNKQFSNKIKLSDDLAEIFEKWRRRK
jgi:predicted RNA-binding protein with PIN domain